MTQYTGRWLGHGPPPGKGMVREHLLHNAEVERLCIDKIITHGTDCGVDGKFTTKDGQSYAFCHVLNFYWRSKDSKDQNCKVVSDQAWHRLNCLDTPPWLRCANRLLAVVPLSRDRLIPRLPQIRLPRVLWVKTPAGRTPAEDAPFEWAELAENACLREAEPGRTRFARFETKAVQRPKIGAVPVSEVRSQRLNAFETKRKRPAGGALSLVCYMIMAERVGFEPTVRSRVQRFSRPPRSTAPAPLRGALPPSGPGLAGGRQDATGPTARRDGREVACSGRNCKGAVRAPSPGEARGGASCTGPPPSPPSRRAAACERPVAPHLPDGWRDRSGGRESD